MRKNFARQMPAQPRHAAVRALARCFTVLKRAVARRADAADPRPLPEEAGMPLVYLPYVPSRFESFLLEGRPIRADVHEWLAARLPQGSRLN